MNVLWLLLPVACLPQDDLESYSRAWENRPVPSTPDEAELGDGSAMDASSGSGGAPGSDGGSPPSGSNGGSLLDAGGAGSIAGDAGVAPSELDASIAADLDAGATPPADADAP